MKFLAGLSKFISIFLMIVGTVVCTAVIISAGIIDGYVEAIWIMSGAWVCVILVCLTILATGVALSQTVKLKKQVEQLEQRLWNQTFTHPVIPATETEIPEAPAAAPVIPPVSETVPSKKSGKTWIFVVIIAVLVIALVAAILLSVSKSKPAAAENEPADNSTLLEAEVETAPVSCPITVNAFCVDDSFVKEEGSSLKLVYLFYTMTAEDSNLQIDSKYTKMYINGNMYEADHFSTTAAACKYTPNYYYGSYIEDVYVGESKNVVATFYVPEGDLAPGKTVTLSDSQIPGVETLSFSTDEFQHFGSAEEIAMTMDPEGYERIQYLRQDADGETTQKVRDLINGYCWTFYVNNISYQLDFWAKNNFSVKTPYTNASGTYTVQNGYVFCTYPDTGYTVEIPYTIEDGKIDLDTIAGFDVMSNN